MNRHDLIFGGVILGVIIMGVLLAPINAVPSIGDIPPTRAFQKIFTNGDNVTATKYNANLNITSGANMLIEAFFSNSTLRFSATAPTLYMEQIANVTSIGCALGQALTVNASAIWACSNVGTGDVTGAANVGTGTGLIFRDETAGTLNLKTLKEGSGITITNNADDITLSSSAVGGYTEINNLDGGTAKILATNSSGHADIKTLTQGTGVTIINGSKTITISASGSSTELNSMNGGTARLLKSNATGEGVFKSLTCTGVTSCTNGTDTITIRSEINSMNGGTAKILKANSTNGEAVLKSLTAGSNISITNGTDTITITSIGGSGSDAEQSNRWGSMIPTSATTVLSGYMVTTTTLEGTETFIYNTTRNVAAISSATPATGGMRWAGLLQNGTNQNIFLGSQNPYLYIEAAPSTKTINLDKIFIGFKSSQPPRPRADDLIVDAISAVAICTRSTDTNYHLCYNDGAGTGTYTNMGVAADTNWHTFKVYTTDNGVTWCGQVDTTTATCTTTDIPATTTRLYWQALLINSPSNIVKIFQYGYVYVQNGK